MDIAGNSEGDFRYQNDLKWQYHKKYEDYHFAEKGIDKGTWADVVQSVYDANHKWDDENKKNVDNPNSAKKVKLGILAVEGLTKAQRIAAYQAFRGKRTNFGWTDWDGESVGGYYRRGFRRWRRWGRRGGSKATAKADQSAFKGEKINIAAPKASVPKAKSTVGVGSSSPKIALNVKTVKPSSTARGGRTNLSAALEDIKQTEKKVLSFLSETAGDGSAMTGRILFLYLCWSLLS